jgi:UDP-N-acetylmuramoyl-L-alanyl-D-glutamate--2,6-diaminopimelate ligase
MKLIDLLSVLPDAVVEGDRGVEVRGIGNDSRTIGRGEVFFALKGTQTDGHRYISDAVARGASAVVLEDDLPTAPAVKVRVRDAKRALALLASRFYGDPWRSLTTVGVTGTSGKTTTTFLIKSVLDAAGIRAGRIGSGQNIVGREFQATQNTTPLAHEVQRLLREMVEKGDCAVVMEVTSHALTLDRVYGIDFRLAVFTNLTRDHLDFHKTERAYFEAKALLFENLRPESGAVLNADDPASAELARRTRAPVLTYGLAPAARVRPERHATDWQGTRMEVATPAGRIEVQSNLRGQFNVSNLLAAVASGIALGLHPDAIRRGLLSVQVPGRFESVDAGQPFAVLVDYAHKPDALEKVLRAARGLTTGRLICVFGCGGDRDRGKRPMMGKIATALSDLTIVTSDNPRTEDPDAIIAEIVAGIPGGAYEVLQDRRQAIHRAVSVARPGDVVLIAGKGDEDYQIIGTVKTHFDDREVAREALKK